MKVYPPFPPNPKFPSHREYLLIKYATLNFIRLLAGLPCSIRLLFIDKPKAHNHQGCNLYNSQAKQPVKVENKICFKFFNSKLSQQTENSIKP